MHHVETAPLIHAQGSEKGMNRYPLHPELAPASIEQLVHGVDFLAQEIASCCPSMAAKRPAQAPSHPVPALPGEASEAEDHQLQRPLQTGALAVAGEVPFVQPGVQRAGGQAIAKHQVFNDLLRAPPVSQALRVQLCCLRVQAEQFATELADNPFHDSVHRGTLGELASLRKCKTPRIGRENRKFDQNLPRNYNLGLKAGRRSSGAALFSGRQRPERLHCLLGLWGRWAKYQDKAGNYGLRPHFSSASAGFQPGQRWRRH